jgi:hypothetical protein
MTDNISDPLRLIVASNRAPHLSVVLETVQNNVKVVQYKYETSTLDDILGKVVEYKELSEFSVTLYNAMCITEVGPIFLCLLHIFIHIEPSFNVRCIEV